MTEHVETILKFKREIYGEYGFYYYVPMPEAYTVQIPVTVSCSYGKCLFCDLNQGMKFRVLSFDEIEENVRKLRCIHDKPAKRFLLAGGNPFMLDTEKLLRISEIVRRYFPECEYISAFSRADDITRKTQKDLKILHEAGYDRLCIGIESGSDEVLTFQNKGVTRSDNLAAMNMLDDSGINYSCYIMLGLGGKNLSGVHVEETASLLNSSSPFELVVVTLVLFRGAKLIEKVKSHEFIRLHPLDALKEGRELLAGLEISTVWNATHKTNIFPVKAKIPEHKTKILERIDKVIQEIESGDIKQYELKRWRKWGLES